MVVELLERLHPDGTNRIAQEDKRGLSQVAMLLGVLVRNGDAP